MNSPRYGPSGLLVTHGGVRVMIDGGPGAEPSGMLDAWLVCDERAELMPEIRRAAAGRGLVPHAGPFHTRGLFIEAKPVVHTNHAAYGYRIRAAGYTIVWAPEFYRFPTWASGADIMFADGAAWTRPIRFAGGVGGHADVLSVAAAARRRQVKRLVFAHIGRPTLRALSRGATPPFGEFAADGQIFLLRPRRAGAGRHRRDDRAAHAARRVVWEGMMARRTRVPRRRGSGQRRLWVHTVTTASTFPPEGLFTKDASTIARALASKRVSPKGPMSGLRMLLFFMNRAGRGLSRTRRVELLRAKRLLQEAIGRAHGGPSRRDP